MRVRVVVVRSGCSFVDHTEAGRAKRCNQFPPTCWSKARSSEYCWETFEHLSTPGKNKGKVANNQGWVRAAGLAKLGRTQQLSKNTVDQCLSQ